MGKYKFSPRVRYNTIYHLKSGNEPLEVSKYTHLQLKGIKPKYVSTNVPPES